MSAAAVAAAAGPNTSSVPSAASLFPIPDVLRSNEGRHLMEMVQQENELNTSSLRDLQIGARSVPMEDALTLNAEIGDSRLDAASAATAAAAAPATPGLQTPLAAHGSTVTGPTPSPSPQPMQQQQQQQPPQQPQVQQRQQQQGTVGSSAPAAGDPLQGHCRYRTIRFLAPPREPGRAFVIQAEKISTNEEVAIKFLAPRSTESFKRYLTHEILNHRKLQHPCIIKFKEVFYHNGYICIVMEYANGGNLLHHLSGPLPEPASRWLFQHLMYRVHYMHQRGVCNRDIKLNNTLTWVYHHTPGAPDVKICDFGYSKSDQQSKPNTQVGTILCMAPEVLTCRGQRYAGDKADIWSCGVLLYMMLTHQHPFVKPGEEPTHPGDLRLILNRIKNAEWLPPPPGSVNEASCLQLIQHMLMKDPDHRASMSDILDHRWFNMELPPQAHILRYGYIGAEKYEGLQTEEQIRDLLQSVFDVAPARLPQQ